MTLVDAQRTEVDGQDLFGPDCAENIRPAQAFDRSAFSLRHDLSSLDLFSEEYITRLAKRYSGCDRDYFVSSPARSASALFFEGEHNHATPAEALASLSSRPVRILLKCLEEHDSGFYALRESLMTQIRRMCAVEGRATRARGSLFISSARSITPVHFDPEVSFFFQVEGAKAFHTFAPTCVSSRTLEAFYARGEVSICEVNLDELAPGARRTFDLAPGRGLHQPQNSPHWVETGEGRSVSYSLVFETETGRRHARVNAFNCYLRMAGMTPPVPGESPAADCVKAAAMMVATPARRKAVHLYRRLVRSSDDLEQRSSFSVQRPRLSEHGHRSRPSL